MSNYEMQAVLYDMKIHDTQVGEDWIILRVMGGWIYTNPTTQVAVFVPEPGPK